MAGHIHGSVAFEDQPVPRLEDHHVSPKYAFLLENPLTKLPKYFQPWITVAENLEASIAIKTIRDEIRQLPLLDHTRLSGHKQWRLANVLLSYITQGYVWVEGRDGIPSVLPRQLAIPYAATSEHLGIPPSLSVVNAALANWKLKDPAKPVELENLEVIINMVGGSHSTCFFMVYVTVELACGPGLSAIIDAQQAVKDSNQNNVVAALQKMETSLHNMTTSMHRMSEGCDPEVFYNILRPFLEGWDNEAFRSKGLEGLIYEGVSSKPKKVIGSTAAQSPIIPCFDAAMGVQHSDPAKALTDAFKQYILPSHRDFIEAIHRGPSIKSYIERSNLIALQQQFNKCVSALANFRSYHFQLVTRYILLMANRKKPSSEKMKSQTVAGTGGAGIVDYLKNMRDDTKETTLSMTEN